MLAGAIRRADLVVDSDCLQLLLSRRAGEQTAFEVIRPPIRTNVAIFGWPFSVTWYAADPTAHLPRARSICCAPQGPSR